MKHDTSLHGSRNEIPTMATLSDTASAFVPMLAARGGEGDQNRRLAEDLIEELAAAGLFKVTLPREYGGYGYTGAASCAVTEQVARGDGSASWVMFNLHAGMWTAGVMSAEAREDIWGADRDVRVCTVNAPRGRAVKVDGGYIVSGKWPFASGCLHAQWATLGAMILKDGQPAGIGVVLIPLAQLGVKLDWDVGGLRGTGSNTLIAEELFVPDHRVGQLAAMTEGRNPYAGPGADAPYYRTGLTAIFTVGIFGSILGLGQAVIDTFTGMLPGREVAYSRGSQIESEIIHLHLARLQLALHDARLASADRNTAVDTAAAMGEPLAPDQKALLRASVSFSARRVLEEAQLIMADAGGRGLAEAGRLPRVLRDLQGLNNHGLVNPFQVLASYGALLVGQEPKTMIA